MTAGPKNPTAPMEDPFEVCRTHWGAVIKCQRFQDGWLYEFAVPADGPLSLWPRPALASIIFAGQWINTFHEDSTNYLAVWVDTAMHKKLLPEGPLPHKYISRDDMDTRTARKDLAGYLEETTMTRSGPLKALSRQD